MIVNLLIGGVLIGLTVMLHALALDLIIKNTGFLEKIIPIPKAARSLRKANIVAVVLLTVAVALVVEIWIWALFYLWVGALPDLETALYFSTATFTTAGYGDVVLDKDWRLLGSIEATNGFLLFGWSTAFIFEVVSMVYRQEGQAIKG